MRRTLLSFFVSLFKRYRSSHADAWAASLSFYTLLSLPALFSFLLGIVRLFVTEEEVQRVWQVLYGTLPNESVREALQTFFSAPPSSYSVAALFALALALFAASKIFGHLGMALNTIWNLSPRPRLEKKSSTIFTHVRTFLQKQLHNFLPLFLLGASLLILVTLHAVVHSVAPLLASLFFFALAALLCAGFFFLFSRRRFAPRQYLYSGALTALLLLVGQIALGIYFRLVDVGSSFGAFGSVVLLLLWLYYSSNMFLLGATAVCSIPSKGKE